MTTKVKKVILRHSPNTEDRKPDLESVKINLN